MLILRFCAVCSGEFMVKRSQLNHGRGVCCSRSCSAALASINRNQKGSANNNWKGGLANQSNTERKIRYRERNPEKHAAHLAMRNAIRKGELIRQPCEICNDEKVEGHHDDYTKPLLVRWLCKKHHLEAHGGRFLAAQPVSSPATTHPLADRAKSASVWLWPLMINRLCPPVTRNGQ